MSLSPANILAKIPGWGSASWSELQAGQTNRLWRVENGGEVGVLKFDEAEREAPFASRPAEAELQRAAARAGLAGEVIFASDGVLLTRFVDGETWHRDCFADHGKLAQLAAALKRLHALPLSGRCFRAATAAQAYAADIHGSDSRVVQACLEVVARERPPGRLCCCHNDLVAENLVSTPALKFLDWEYASDNDPFFDLATIVEHHELSDKQVEVLLNAYFDGEACRWQDPLRTQRKRYLALLFLWMAARPDTDAGKLEAVQARVLTSCF